MVAGRRPKEQTSWSDAYCTPKRLADMLPEVDFDPCSNDRSWIKAAWSFTLEKCLDGLKLPWRGKGFINWPYSKPMPWVIKAMYEMQIGRCTDLIVLCKLDSSTTWWEGITQNVLGVVDRWELFDRVQYEEPPEAIAERMQKRKDALEAYAFACAEAKERNEPKPKKAEFKIPPIKVSNNFASVIIHHRAPDAPALDLWEVATLWRQVPHPRTFAMAA